MNAADLELERHLAELREEAAPSAADKLRVLASVRGVLESTRVPPFDPASPLREPAPLAPRPRPLPAARTAGGSLRPWLGGALIGAALGVGLGFVWGRGASVHDAAGAAAAPSAAPRIEGVATPPLEGAAPPLESAAPPIERSAAPSAPVSADAAAAARPTTVRPTEARGRAVRPRAGAGAAPRTLELERALALLRRAERALHAAEPGLALGLLRELDRDAARSLLREERLTTLALALCQLDRKQEARAAREALQREFQASIYAARLERSCASEPPELQ